MNKITIKVSNSTAPLDHIHFVGEKIQEREIDNLNDYNQIIDMVTKFISTIENANKTKVKARVLNSKGSMIFDGVFDNGNFTNGIISS